MNTGSYRQSKESSGELSLENVLRFLFPITKCEFDVSNLAPFRRHISILKTSDRAGWEPGGRHIDRRRPPRRSPVNRCCRQSMCATRLTKRAPRAHNTRFAQSIVTRSISVARPTTVFRVTAAAAAGLHSLVRVIPSPRITFCSACFVGFSFLSEFEKNVTVLLLYDRTRGPAT